MSYVINRSFDRRTGANVGKVELVAPAGKYTLDGKELPEASVNALLRFSLQLLQDSYAGAKSDEEATGMFLGKYDRLREGTLGTRGDGTGADPFTLVARSVVRGMFMANNAKGSDAREKFLALGDAEQIAKLDEWFAGNEAALRPEVEKEMKLRAERAANKANAAKKVSFSL